LTTSINARRAQIIRLLPGAPALVYQQVTMICGSHHDHCKGEKPCKIQHKEIMPWHCSHSGSSRR